MAGFLNRMVGFDVAPQPRRDASPNPVPPAQTMTPTGTPSQVGGLATSSTDYTAGTHARAGTASRQSPSRTQAQAPIRPPMPFVPNRSNSGARMKAMRPEYRALADVVFRGAF